MIKTDEKKEYEKINSEKLKKWVSDIRNEERKRIARDLHDSIGCLLSTTTLLFDTVEPINKERFEEAKSLLKTTQIELRRIVNDLTPQTLEKFGLKAAVHQLCEQISQKDEFVVSCKMEDLEELELEVEMEINVYRIVQELLNNAIKYSKASKVELLLTHKSDWVLLKVKDDGVGVPNDLVNGLSIRERVLSLNGKIAIENLSVGIETQIFLPI